MIHSLNYIWIYIANKRTEQYKYMTTNYNNMSVLMYRIYVENIHIVKYDVGK